MTTTAYVFAGIMLSILLALIYGLVKVTRLSSVHACHSPVGSKDEVIADLSGFIAHLWAIVDDIDTATDRFKADDAAYRRYVENRQAARWTTGITTDGYTLHIPGLTVIPLPGLVPIQAEEQPETGCVSNPVEEQPVVIESVKEEDYVISLEGKTEVSYKKLFHYVLEHHFVFCVTEEATHYCVIKATAADGDLSVEETTYLCVKKA